MAEVDTKAAATRTGKVRTPAMRLKAEAERCRVERREFIVDWSENIDYRRGKEFNTDDDRDRRRLPIDWSMVNAKMSQLFSQVPRVIATGRGPYKAAATAFEEQLNFRLQKASVGTTMNEIMADVVNAAGVGIAKVEYRVTVDTQQRASVDTSKTVSMFRKMLNAMSLSNPDEVTEPPTEAMDVPIDKRFDVLRISPEDFIWPLEFKRSNFNLAPFLGNDGEMTREEAATRLKLTDEQLEKAVGKVKGPQDEVNSESSIDRGDREDTEIVPFTELFYWRYLYHKDEKYFDAIQRLVFVNGIEDPVINERWNGQRFDDAVGGYIGSCKFPIQVMTLHYISDEAIPPSDSAVARPLVNGLERTFEQIEDQRDFAKPVQWVNTNRVDADILYLLMQGQWQGRIPTNGKGDDAIGEVARPNYPNEDYAFHRTYEDALLKTFSVGPNQLGVATSGRRSATESATTQANYTTRLTQERAMGVQFFLNIADVMAGLVSLYDDFELPQIDPQKAQGLAFWDRTRISHTMAFSIRGDSTVLLDAEQRLDRAERFINIAGKSGYMYPKPVLEEYAALSGFDPATCIRDPEPPKDEAPNISFRFSGEDLLNPMVYGMLLKTPYGLTEDELKAAISAVNAAKLSMQVVTPPTPDGTPVPPAQVPQLPGMQDDRPDWQSVDRVNSRRDASQNGAI